VTGRTDGTNWPVSGTAYQGASCGGAVYPSTASAPAAFLTKLNPSGTGLLYSTYLCGNTNASLGEGVTVNGTEAYLVGYTVATNFPTVGALQTSHGGGVNDAFVAVIDTALSGAASLTYASYFGSSGSDTGWGIAVDSP